MKKLVVIAAFLLLAAVGHAVAAEMTAGEIVAKSWDLFRLAKDERELVRVSVAYHDGRREEKELTRWTLYEPSGEDKVAIRFSKPALDDGLMLLVWRHPGKSDDVWLKLPSFAQERRVSTSDQGKYFAETDLTYEDTRQLIGERIGDFEYRMTGRSGSGWTIEATAKPGVDTAYGKRVFAIDPRYVFTKIEYYAKGGTPIKTQTNTRVTVDRRGRWRVDQVELDNHLLKRKTTMKIVERKVDQNISPEVFSRKFLTGRKR
ncbi:MAG: hypothetical protein A4E69_00034 [Syntrophus sp. PtaB.Bin138]|jgi:hypothetical protein|nr:MAG: hypothetical protein A4E69_00034 [Syntrophus sp. PtaB.Bin138]